MMHPMERALPLAKAVPLEGSDPDRRRVGSGSRVRSGSPAGGLVSGR